MSLSSPLHFFFIGPVGLSNYNWLLDRLRLKTIEFSILIWMRLALPRRPLFLDYGIALVKKIFLNYKVLTMP